MLDLEIDFGAFESECQACDVFGPVDDLGLCEACAAKLDRDMIRQRAWWDYSATAFGLSAENREALRSTTIAEHGAALELIAPDVGPNGLPRRRPRRG